MISTKQTVDDLLEGTIEALLRFDLERLLSLEERMILLASSGASVIPTPALLEKWNRLKRTLDGTQCNLEILTGLHSRKECGTWDR